MPGFLTDYSNNKLLDNLFGGVAFGSPGTLYFGLSTRPANKTGQVTEPSGGAYARVALANNSTNFPGSNLGAKSNSSAITFPSPTADWGTIVSVFVSDAASGGNIVAMADLASPRVINSGSTPPTLAAGAFYLSHT